MFLSSVISIGSFLFVLSSVIFVHEFGHYLMARIAGVKIEEFSIGFWKPLFAFKDKSGTLWKLCSIPFGGYVKMLGDEDGTSFNVKDSKLGFQLNKKHRFDQKPIFVKILIVFAGPLANYITAIILMFSVFAVSGRDIGLPVVNGFSASSPARESGILSGDLIVSVDEVLIDDVSALRRAINMKNGNPVKVTVERGGELHSYVIAPHISNQTNGVLYTIGVLTPQYEKKYMSPLTALKQSFVDVFNISKSTVQMLCQMISGSRGTGELGGPVAIAKQAAVAARAGIAPLIMFIAFISTSVGLLNLFPIPLLDGGQIIVYLIELVCRRRLHSVFYVILQWFSFGIIGLLIALSTFNDVASIFLR